MRATLGRLPTVIVAVAAGLSMILMPSAVSANSAVEPGLPAIPVAPGESGKSVGMALRGFDAAVARANGYEIVTLPDGAQASVPAERAEAARSGTYRPSSGILAKEARDEPTTFGYAEVPGECGVSYVALNATGGSRANLGTGFWITNSGAGNVWDVSWRVSIVDRGGSSNQRYNEDQGLNWGTGWDAHVRDLSLTVGLADATVAGGSSYTITTHGWICWSYGPTAVENIW